MTRPSTTPPSTTPPATSQPASTQPASTQLASKNDGLDTLEQIRRRVLWLSTSIVHHANRVRPNPTD